MPTVLITGGTGMIGESLAKTLVERGYKVIILTRAINGKQPTENTRYAYWDLKTRHMDLAALQQADYIIHLAGTGVVDKKWTEAYKKEIRDSRTGSSRIILDALKNNPNKVKAIVSMSAIGWYGADTDPAKPFEEDSPADSSFLGETCRLWEQSMEPALVLGIRLVKLRTGIVLSKQGGALAEFKKPLRFGMAAILGSGKQIVSWIHIEDLCRMFIYAMENENLQGSFNAVATEPVSNKTLILTLAKIMNSIFYIPLNVPTIILKIMMGERSIEVLKSTTVSCRKIMDAGFTFSFPNIRSALMDLVK